MIGLAGAWRRHRLCVFLVGAALLVGLGIGVLDAVSPFPLASLEPPVATAVLAKNGEPLRLFLAADEAWRFPTRLSAIAPILPRILVAAEDRHFRRHPGVNPLSLVRAALSNLRAGHVVSGGSTITMQLARLAHPRPRTLGAKLVEAFRALQLERRLSKNAILERYCNMAPYGGNIVGVGAASFFYFDKTPDRLSLAEAALLTVLPRSPLRFDPIRHPRAARDARNRLLAALARRRVIGAAAAREAMRAPMPAALTRLPFLAPHFCEFVREQASAGPRLVTTLDPAAQQVVRNILRRRTTWLHTLGIGSVAAVVLDPASRDILAMVGGTDYFGDTRFGQINGTVIRRSPGSALKPFLYAMALDAGLVFPQSLLLDVPTGFGGYAPKNYDGQFRGRVTTEEALVNSLNVPAVRLLDRIGTAAFLDVLRRGGLSTLDKPAEHYGLSLVLGSGEVTLLSLTNGYADLASFGEHRSPRLLPGPLPPGQRLFSREACAMVTRMLTKLERPDLPTSWERALAVPAVAWKTGTSYGHRDAWAVGYSADHVIGVWVGNMDGTPVKGISGAAYAGPILFELFRALEEHGSRLLTPPGLDIATVEVCAESRQLPGPHCPHRVLATIIPGRTRLGPCPIHRQVLVDARTGLRLEGDCLLRHPVKSAVIAQYPPELVSWWRASGIPFEAPPALAPGCGSPDGERLHIVSPSPATPYRLRRDAPASFQQIVLTADVPAASRRLTWYVDGEIAAQGEPGKRLFWQPTPGRHRLMVADDRGRYDAVTVVIE